MIIFKKIHLDLKLSNFFDKITASHTESKRNLGIY